MILNYEDKKVQIKIVYYGTAMSGKTTSLKSLMSRYNKIDDLYSVETSTGRTLVLDYGSLFFSGNEWDLEISLLSATGQDFYASTRPATLQMTDGIIFIFDSQLRYFEDNLRSWNELYLFFGGKIYDLPIIISLNKQDLNNVLDPILIKNLLSLTNFRRYEIIKTIATKGVGVLKCFQNLMQLIIPSIVIPV
jgi:GTPase SAR1 family protein